MTALAAMPTLAEVPKDIKGHLRYSKEVHLRKTDNADGAI
jgi:hypothetical protein